MRVFSNFRLVEAKGGVPFELDVGFYDGRRTEMHLYVRFFELPSYAHETTVTSFKLPVREFQATAIIFYTCHTCTALGCGLSLPFLRFLFNPPHPTLYPVLLFVYFY